MRYPVAAGGTYQGWHVYEIEDLWSLSQNRSARIYPAYLAGACTKTNGLVIEMENELPLTSLPLVIGQTAAGEPYTLSLAAQPHLFVSYAEENHLQDFFVRICEQWQLNNEMGYPQIALAVKSALADRLQMVITPDSLFRLYRTNPQGLELADSARLFFRTLMREFRRRVGKRQRMPEKAAFPPLVIFSDEVLGLAVIGRRRATGDQLLRLLAEGPAVGIHAVLATGVSFRNLVQQLMRTPVPPSTAEQLLGRELVLSGEGLVFYREEGQMNYRKLYSF